MLNALVDADRLEQRRCPLAVNTVPANVQLPQPHPLARQHITDFPAPARPDFIVTQVELEQLGVARQRAAYGNRPVVTASVLREIERLEICRD